MLVASDLVSLGKGPTPHAGAHILLRRVGSSTPTCPLRGDRSPPVFDEIKADLTAYIPRAIGPIISKAAQLAPIPHPKPAGAAIPAHVDAAKS